MLAQRVATATTHGVLGTRTYRKFEREVRKPWRNSRDLEMGDVGHLRASLVLWKLLRGNCGNDIPHKEKLAA